MESFGLYFIHFLLVFVSVTGKEFEYSEQAKWYDDYKQCSYTKQSPIELISEEATVSYQIPPLKFLFYDSVFCSPATIQNNGHTANIVLPKPQNFNPSISKMYDKYKPQVFGGPLSKGIFIADSVHFHWGSRDTHGSEHVIDSQRFSMEMHIVHRNSKYRTVEKARDYEDGLAVLAVIYNVMENATKFDGLQSVVDSLPRIVEFENETQIDEFSLTPLLGDLDRDEYFTYKGSLTTPPCSQAVTWIVFTNPVPIVHDQMSAFHRLINPHGTTLENNYRFLQAKGTRNVILHKSGLKLLYAILNNFKPAPFVDAVEA